MAATAPTPPSGPRPRSRMWLPWLAGLVGILVSVAGALQLRNLEQRNVSLLSEDEVSARTSAVERDVRDAIALATAAKVVFDSSRDVSRGEFRTLARQLLPTTAVPATLAWVPRVTRDQRGTFERQVRESGVTDFLIYDRFGPGDAQEPAPERDEYFPVLYMEPSMPVPPGFDPAANPRRLRALQRAGRSASPAADRVGDPPLPHGFALSILAPVYDVPFAPDGVVARQAALRGFVATHADLESFFATSLTRIPRRMATNTWLLDEEGLVLFRRIEGAVEPPAAPTATDLRRGAYFERIIQIADRRWSLIFHPQGRAPVTTSLVVLLLGLLLTLFLALYTGRLLNTEQRLATLVEERTRELRVTLDQLQQAQKMEAVGRLTGGIAHDFNNLLTIVMGNIGLARDAIADEHVRTSYLDPALGAAERGASLTQRLLAFSRRQTLQPRVVQVAALVEGMRPLVERALGGAVVFEVSAATDAWPTRVDPSQLEASVLNLCINARDAMPTGGTIALIIENTQLNADPGRTPDDVVPGDYVMVSVVDSGEGMSEQVQAQAFEPFFTTKGIGKGSGLGLSMVFGFVKQSHGHITITSAPGRGTTVRMYFARARE